MMQTRKRSALAVSSYLNSFNAQYGTSGTKLDTCSTCHNPDFSRNPYGLDFAAAGHSFTAIESKDSDGDGYTNIVEINARTFPGDPADHPAPAPTPTPTPTPGPVKVANVTFYVTNDETGLPIDGTTVLLDRTITKITDMDGKAIFTDVALGRHNYTVNKDGFEEATGKLTVNHDKKVSVELEPVDKEEDHEEEETDTSFHHYLKDFYNFFFL